MSHASRCLTRRRVWPKGTLRLVSPFMQALLCLAVLAACGKDARLTAPSSSALELDTLFSRSAIKATRPRIIPPALELSTSFLGNSAQRLSFVLGDGTAALPERGGIRWESSDSTIATVDAVGVVRSGHEGVAVIRAALGDYADSIVVRTSATTSGIGLIAHRGFGSFSPENTLPAFRRALSFG